MERGCHSGRQNSARPKMGDSRNQGGLPNPETRTSCAGGQAVNHQQRFLSASACSEVLRVCKTLAGDRSQPAQTFNPAPIRSQLRKHLIPQLGTAAMKDLTGKWCKWLAFTCEPTP